jgi:hypothetical protein
MIELSDGLDHEVTGFRLEGQRAILDRAFEFVPSPPDPDELWSSPRVLFSVYQETLSPGGKRKGPESDHSISIRVRFLWIFSFTYSTHLLNMLFRW